MQFTVKNVMELEVMKQGRVRTAKNMLDSIPVGSISVIEIPVEDFVQKHEFVLTTGVGCGHDPSLFQRFVEDIARSHASALGVATGRHIINIPENVLRYAEKENFPIIEIPWEVRFADIMKDVLEQLQNWQRSVLKESEEMQRQLLQLFMSGADLTVFARVLQQKINRPVFITDQDDAIKGFSPTARDIVQEWNEHALIMDHPLDWQMLRSQNIPFTHVSFSHFKQHTLMRLAVGYASRTQGYIMVSIPPHVHPESFLDSGNANILEHAVTVAALWFQREHAIQETEMRLRGDFVWSLARGEFDSWDTVLSQAKTLQFNVNLPYVCMLGYPENLDDLYKKRKKDAPAFEQWKQNMINHIEEQLISAGKNLNKEVMTTYQRDHFIVFLQIPQRQNNDSIHQYLDEVERLLKEILPGLSMSWGIGENSAGVNRFHESFDDARIALNVGRRQRGPGQRSTYANTGIYRTLQCLAGNDEIKEIALSTIGTLLEHDEQKGLDLVRTLATYIRHQRNVSQTARALNLHRQSLLYRLKKIETLTDRSLMDPDDLFLLDLSIKLWTTGMTLDQ